MCQMLCWILGVEERTDTALTEFTFENIPVFLLLLYIKCNIELQNYCIVGDWDEGKATAVMERGLLLNCCQHQFTTL